MRGWFLDRSPATEYIFETSTISEKSILGRIVANALASIVFPDPGGPSMRILCPQAAAIVSARLACSCPMICSNPVIFMLDLYFSINTFESTGVCSGRDLFPVSISTSDMRFSIPMRCTHGMSDASSRFSCGRNIYLIPCSLANMTDGRTALTLRSFPSRASSPTKSPFFM